jgi:hypothetical protein
MDAPSIQKLGEMHFAGGGDVDKMTVEALKACLWNLFRPAPVSGKKGELQTRLKECMAVRFGEVSEDDPVVAFLRH